MAEEEDPIVFRRKPKSETINYGAKNKIIYQERAL